MSNTQRIEVDQNGRIRRMDIADAWIVERTQPVEKLQHTAVHHERRLFAEDGDYGRVARRKDSHFQQFTITQLKLATDCTDFS